MARDELIAEERRSQSWDRVSPLSPLRLSLVAPPSNSSKPRSQSQPLRRKHKTSTLKQPRNADGTGFDFDISLDSLTHRNDKNVERDNHLGKNDANIQIKVDLPNTSNIDLSNIENTFGDDVRRYSHQDIATDACQANPTWIAKFLLDSNRAMNARYNIMDSMNENEPVQGENTRKHDLKITHGAMNRAKIVQAILALKYVWIGKCQRIPEGETVRYPGVEGVYNPLQVIRNREIRAKYHEYPPPLSHANLPLPCNAFSSHNLSGNRRWKMTWAVELNELINDIPWRKSHWHELRNPKGELWAPLPGQHDLSSLESFPSPSKSKRSKKGRLHDKLWLFEPEAVDPKDPTPPMAPTTPVPSSKSLLGFRKNLKEKAKRIYHSNSDNEYSSNDNSKSNESLMRAKLAHRFSQSDIEDYNGLLPSNSHSHKNSKSSSKDDSFNSRSAGPPLITVNDALDDNENKKKDQTSAAHIENTGSDHKGRLGDVAFTPVHSRATSDLSSIHSLEADHTHIPDLGEQLEQPQEEAKEDHLQYAPPREPKIEDLQLASIISNQKYLDQLLYVNENFLTSIMPHIAASTSLRVDSIMENEMNSLLQLILQINDFQIPSYERFFGGFLDECKSLTHVINDNYAVRIDNLLSATDRSIGELNTSLALDLRKVNEQLDKLNLSLFGNIVTEALNERKNAVRFSSGDDHKILYYFLENAIVVTLRLAWVVVNIYKFFAGIVKLVLKVILFFFGF